VDSLEFLSALKEKGYNQLVIQKGNGQYCPRVVVPLGQTQAHTHGIAVKYVTVSTSYPNLLLY
jgi:beta-1,4-N-acetylglucosaminyltransferase